MHVSHLPNATYVMPNFAYKFHSLDAIMNRLCKNKGVKVVSYMRIPPLNCATILCKGTHTIQHCGTTSLFIDFNIFIYFLL